MFETNLVHLFSENVLEDETCSNTLQQSLLCDILFDAQYFICNSFAYRSSAFLQFINSEWTGFYKEKCSNFNSNENEFIKNYKVQYAESFTYNNNRWESLNELQHHNIDSHLG